MNSGRTTKLPPLLSKTDTDIPLDLSVKRAEMTELSGSDAPELSRFEDRRYSMPASFMDKNYRHGEPLVTPRKTSDPEEISVRMNTDNGHSVSPSPAPMPSVSHGADVGPGHMNTKSEESPEQPCGSPSSALSAYNFESVHPKKRKNLWRPYDCEFDEDKDGDSSDSNSASDQDAKAEAVTEAWIDPMKKRKMDMLKYAERLDQFEKRPSSVPATGEVQMSEIFNSEASTCAMGIPESLFKDCPEVDSVPALSRINEDITKAQLALFTNFPESREKLVTGMKKRDIFGWSLKLASPSVDDVKSSMITQSSDIALTQGRPTENVCMEGDKTYYELQTVRKSSSSPKSLSRSPPSEQGHNSPSPKKVKSSQPKQGKNAKKRQSSSSPPSPNDTGDTTASKSKVENGDVESPSVTPSLSPNASPPKVVIIGKEKTTTVDLQSEEDSQKEETTKRRATYQSLSLIDLVEEIEAEAKEKEKSQSKETTKKKNNGIAALLQQCNHVKVTALDFLMSNVLLAERERPYQPKNARVQQMLKGDKIKSVNMLDVLELQVEVGLS